MAGPFYVDPAAAGSNNGSSWTHAWTSIQSAFDTVAANEICYCRGTQTFGSAATLDLDTQTGGNATGFIKFIGCNALGNVDGTRFTIDVNSQAVHGITTNATPQMYWIENIEIINAGTAKSAMSFPSASNSGFVFINCSFSHCASNGIADGLNLRNSQFIRCTFHSNGGHGFYRPYSTIFIACSFYDNSDSGMNTTGYSSFAPIFGCIFHGNTDDGIEAASNIPIINSVIDGNGDDGMSVLGTTNNYVQIILLGTRITNHSGAGDFGIFPNTEPCLLGWNYFEQGGSGVNIDTATDDWVYTISVENTTTDSNKYDQTDTDTGYVNPGSHDFATDYTDGTDPSNRREKITVPWT